MNLDALQTKLVNAAKANPPSQNVPYCFEKRVMTNLRGHSPMNVWALWGQPMWRAALSCIAITMLCGVWSLAHLNLHSSDSGDLSQDFESAVYAGLNVDEAAW